MDTPTLHRTFEFHVDLGTPIDIGPIARGSRRIVPFVGGRFEGSGLSGTIVNGSDYQVIRDDEVVDIEARYTLQTDAGALIGVHSVGMRHAPSDVTRRMFAGEPVDQRQIYFRTTITFETSAPELGWLMRSIFIAIGERHAKHVALQVWRVD